MKMSLATKISTLLVTIALSGCGFQLRGTDAMVELPRAFPVEVRSPYPIINQQFERELIRQGFTVVPTEGEYVIRVQGETADEIDFVFDTEFEFPFNQLNYRLRYVVTDSGGAILIGPDAVAQSSDYYFMSGTHLQHEVAKNSALEQLRRRAASQIVHRLVNQLTDQNEAQVID